MSTTFTPTYLIPVAGFQSRKAAQVCVHFALLSGGTIEKLKLIKLVYLAERNFLKKTNYPMLFDEFYSLKNGPICSSTLNGIDGNIDEDIWNEFLARNGNIVVSIKKFSREDLDEVSDAEIENLDEIWNQFGGKTSSQLVQYTHKHCPEYTEIEKGRVPILYQEIFQALGIRDAEILDNEIQSYRRVEGLLSRA